MKFNQTMSELKKMGTAQNAKIYKRHGACGDLFGVSFANLGILKKKIKINHELALELWDSKNVDARTLAIMIADPSKMKPSTANAWLKEIDYYLIADLFSGLIAKTKFAKSKISKWSKSKKEYICQTGYSTLASALKLGVDFSDKYCKAVLQEIESNIHSSPNRARHSMNNAVIAIGVFRPELSTVAIETARRIGKVTVDHGETSCKTPEAVAYIKKSLKRMKKR